MMRRLPGLVAVLVVLGGCTIGPTELRQGDCVDIVGTGSSTATERLVTVDCDTAETDGVFRVVWIRQAADSDPLTVTMLAADCAGPTLLPDADMLKAGDRSVVCFEPLD